MKVLTNRDNFMAITNDILDELIGNAKTQEDLFGKDDVIKGLSKQLVERMLQAEMSHHLGYEKHAPEIRENLIKRPAYPKIFLNNDAIFNVFRACSCFLKIFGALFSGSFK